MSKKLIAAIVMMIIGIIYCITSMVFPQITNSITINDVIIGRGVYAVFYVNYLATIAGLIYSDYLDQLEKNEIN